MDETIRKTEETGTTTGSEDASPRIAVFAPAPVLTITIEPGTDQHEVHLHAGGQGVWVAHLAATLGAEVVLCCALGGEPGNVIRALLEALPLTVRAAEAAGPSGVYVHDRRGGTRVEIARVEGVPLGRHCEDELYGITLTAGLDADVTLITGCQPSDICGAEIYRRLVADLRANGQRTIADLTGAPLSAALGGAVDLLHISDEELLRDGWAATPHLHDLSEAAGRLRDAGAANVLVSRAEDPALLFEGGDLAPIELRGPRFQALDHTGAGDSMFAAIGVGYARGLEMLDAVRLGMAAGALNVTRRGLGTGTRDEIEHLAAHVAARRLRAFVGSPGKQLSARRLAVLPDSVVAPMIDTDPNETDGAIDG
jgi:1-phosphofructokinase